MRFPNLKKIFNKLFIIGAFFAAMPPIAGSATIADYCSTPPFVGTSVPPNVLIVLDNSGSMNDEAYATTYNPTQFSSGYYYGLFDPAKYYQYTNNGRWEEVTGYTAGTDAIPSSGPSGAASTTNPIASGNFMNWANMSRISVAKKLLIGGKASPRSPQGTVTVKLYGETTWGFSKSFDNTSTANLITPFTGNYRYSVSSSAALSISPVSAGSSTIYTSPNADISIPAGWTVYPATPTTAWDKVDDTPPYTNNDGDTTYIQAQNTASPAMFDYNYTGGNIGTITSVGIRVVAKKSASTSTTRRIQGVLTISGTNYAASYKPITSSYATYSFDWTTNPATGAAWQWSAIKSSGAGSLQAFGVQAYQAYTSYYPRITQVYLVVTSSTPSGGPYSIIIDQGMTKASGIIDTLSSSARFGLMYYATSSDGGTIQNYVDFGSTTNMITSISNLSPSTWTPLGETIYEAVRYFEQVSPYYSNSPADYKTGTNYDPYYFQYSKDIVGGSDRYVPCAKSFILLLTDGEPTQDQNIPASIAVAGKSGYSWGKGVKPDGSSTGSAYKDLRLGGTANGQTYSSNGTDYLVDVAYYARTTDHRTATMPGGTVPDLTGTQNIIIYTAFMFGSGSTLLKDAAIYGGFNDLNGDGKPGPDVKEYLRDSNGDGHISDGSDGYPADLPTTYFEGDDGYALQQSIIEAITSIMKRAASGTAVSVLTTSSRGVGSMVQAYFLPTRTDGTRDVTWTGYLQNLWIDPWDNLREDTTQDYQLIPDSAGRSDGDQVLKLYFDSNTNETKAATFTTAADGSGGTLAQCSTGYTTKTFADVNYLWEAGKKLALQAPSTRNLFTSTKTLLTSGTAAPFATTTNNFTTATGCGSLTSSVNCFTSSKITGAVTPGAATCTGLTGETLTKCNALNSDTTFTPGKIVSYVRGECLETNDGTGSPITGDTACTTSTNGIYRDRRLTSLTVSGLSTTGNVWKLGDIISSTPKVFAGTNLNTYNADYGDSTYTAYWNSDTYKKKSAISFVGANDGMLHAFRVGYLKDTGLASYVKALFKNFFGTTGTDNTGAPESSDTANDRLGEEVWGYIPFNAFPYLKYLADPSYCHVYFNDLSVRLVDASIGDTAGGIGGTGGLPTDAKASNGSNWRTVLIGGMRFGGACNSGTPDIPVTGSGVGYSAYFAINITDPENPVPLWEFTDNDLGYAAAFPAIIRTGDPAKNGYWYVAFGSGSTTLPKSGTDVARSTSGYLYLVDLRTGALVQKIQLDHNAIVGDVLSIDANKDYVSESLYFGTTYGSTGSWQGKLVKISIPTATANADLSTWTPQASDIKYIFSDNYPFTASPDAAKDDKGNIWVYIGSGKYYSDVDKTDTSQQIFLGVKDMSSGITYPVSTTSVSPNNMDNRTGSNVTGTVTGTAKVCTFNQTLNGGAGGFELQDYVTSISPTSTTPSASNVGWYINLSTSPAAERVISRPLAVGGLVDFLTYMPSSDVCSYGGDSYIYAVGYTTGAAPSVVALSSSSITGGSTSGTVTVQQGMKIGPGAPPTGEAIVVTPPKPGEENLQKKIQVATGVVIEAQNKTPESIATKIVHWLKK